MSTPFPGMDPYLERSDLWPDVHNSLIAGLRDVLAPQLAPRYYVSVEERTYIAQKDKKSFAGRPDLGIVKRRVRETRPAFVAATGGVALAEPVLVTLPILDYVRETFLEVRAVDSDRVVTVIEILSPANKRATGEGRKQYEQKRLDVLNTITHLVEIDLLRGGIPMFIWEDQIKADYRILISRCLQRPHGDLFPFDVRDPIPNFVLPLRRWPIDQQPEPVVQLGAVLHDLYDRARYDLRVDYTKEPTPRLSKEDAAWGDALLREASLR
ncbi:MAG: DUF4058 family protein [Ardenticatenaceae bacterium]